MLWWGKKSLWLILVVMRTLGFACKNKEPESWPTSTWYSDQRCRTLLRGWPTLSIFAFSCDSGYFIRWSTSLNLFRPKKTPPTNLQPCDAATAFQSKNPPTLSSTRIDLNPKRRKRRVENELLGIWQKNRKRGKGAGKTKKHWETSTSRLGNCSGTSFGVSLINHIDEIYAFRMSFPGRTFPLVWKTTPEALAAHIRECLADPWCLLRNSRVWWMSLSAKRKKVIIDPT